MTIKETNVVPQWQTFNVMGGMIARNEAGQVEGMLDLGHGVVFTFASSGFLMSPVCSTPLRHAGQGHYFQDLAAAAHDGHFSGGGSSTGDGRFGPTEHYALPRKE